jgi:hypothetical protein
MFEEETRGYSSFLDMIEGDLPGRAQQMIREWAHQYHAELQSMWQSQTYKRLPGLEE